MARPQLSIEQILRNAGFGDHLPPGPEQAQVPHLPGLQQQVTPSPRNAKQDILLVFTYLKGRRAYNVYCILGNEFGKRIPMSSLEGKILPQESLSFEFRSMEDFVKELESVWDKAEVGYLRQNSELPKPGDIMFSYTLVPIRSGLADSPISPLVKNYKTAKKAVERWHGKLHK